MGQKRLIPDIEDTLLLPLRQLEILRKWRVGKVADVDIYGCDKLADQVADAKTKRFQILVSLLLSSQTKDPITAGAIKRLQERTGLTPAGVRSHDQIDLEELIKPVGFYRMKAGYLKKISEILGNKYDDDIPKSFDEIVKLPGIGPKMAYLTMQCAWDDCVGIGVDVHVHRISGRLGWTTNAKVPEDTRLQLQNLFPKDVWAELNPLLIGFGQLQCLPLRPKCADCPLKDFGCKFYEENGPLPGKRKKSRN